MSKLHRSVLCHSCVYLYVVSESDIDRMLDISVAVEQSWFTLPRLLLDLCGVRAAVLLP